MKIVSSRNFKMKSKSPISDMHISQKSSLMAIGQTVTNGGYILNIYDLSTNELIFSDKSTSSDLRTLSFIPNRDLLCYVTHDSKVNILDCNSMTITESFNTGNRISNLRFSNNLMMLIGTRLEIWDWKKVTKLWFLSNYQGGVVTDNWSYDSLPVTWDYLEYKKDQSYFNMPAYGIFASKKDEIFVSGNNTAKIIRLNWKSYKVRNEIVDAPLQVSNAISTKKRNFMMLSGVIPDGDFLWNLDLGKRILTNIFNENMGASYSALFHPGGNFIARGFKYGHVSINRLIDGKTLFMEELHKGEVTSLCFNSIGDTLYTSGMDGKVNIVSLKVE